MMESPYKAPYVEPILIEDDSDAPPAKRQKTTPAASLIAPKKAQKVPLVPAGPGPRAADSNVPQADLEPAPAQSADGTAHPSAPLPSVTPARVTIKLRKLGASSLDPAAESSSHVPSPNPGQAPEVDVVPRPVLKMKKTGTAGLPDGYRAPYHGTLGELYKKTWIPSPRDSTSFRGDTLPIDPVDTGTGTAASGLRAPVGAAGVPRIVLTSTRTPTPARTQTQTQMPASTPGVKWKAPASNYPTKTGRPRGRPRKDRSTHAVPLPDPSTIPHHSLTLDGQPYEFWLDRLGNRHPGEGALFPAGYVPDLEGSFKAFSCPVIGCKVALQYPKSYGKHFKTAHGNCCLNDNQDGTFSVVSYHGGAEKPLVVSREAAAPTSQDGTFRVVYYQGRAEKPLVVSREARHPPPVAATPTGQNGIASATANPHAEVPGAEPGPRTNLEPQTESGPPGQSTSMPAESSRFSDLIEQLTGNSDPSIEPDGASARKLDELFATMPGETLELPAHVCRCIPEATLGKDGPYQTWVHVRPHFKNFKNPPTAGWTMDLLKLPKRRDLAWNQPWLLTHRFVDKLARDVVATLAQVTGDEAREPCTCCLYNNDGPFVSCIVMSKTAPPEARDRIAACANCTYDGREESCSLWIAKKAEEDRLQSEARNGANARQNASNGEPPLKDTSLSPPSSLASSLASTPPAAPGQPQQQQRQPPPEPRTRAEQPEPQRPHQPTDHLEVEDWEAAPGRLLSTADADPDADPVAGRSTEAIAFSRTYLSASQSSSVRVGADASFRVDVIGGGSSRRLAAKRDAVRVCSVGAGKVRVRIAGEAEFALGPHGMFRLLPGRDCLVLNRLYGEAVLHVCEIPE